MLVFFGYILNKENFIYICIFNQASLYVRTKCYIISLKSKTIYLIYFYEMDE